MSLTPFLRRPPNTSAQLRLFCASHAGGGTALFAPWRRIVPPWLDICPLILPARESRFREAARTDLVALSDELAEELAPHLQLPYAFLGYSLGGLLSFEIVRRLRERQLPLPTCLLVGAARAPQLLRPFATLLDLSDEAFFMELGRRYGGMRPEVWENKELRSLILPSLRGDFEMLETYRYTPGPPLDVPLAAFAGSEDEATSPEAIEPWREQTTRAFKLHTFSGGHFFINTASAEFQAATFAELALAIER